LAVSGVSAFKPILLRELLLWFFEIEVFTDFPGDIVAVATLSGVNAWFDFKGLKFPLFSNKLLDIIFIYLIINFKNITIMLNGYAFQKRLEEFKQQDEEVIKE
jgi:hypothetical protein